MNDDYDDYDNFDTGDAYDDGDDVDVTKAEKTSSATPTTRDWLKDLQAIRNEPDPQRKLQMVYWYERHHGPLDWATKHGFGVPGF